MIGRGSRFVMNCRMPSSGMDETTAYDWHLQTTLWREIARRTESLRQTTSRFSYCGFGSLRANGICYNASQLGLKPALITPRLRRTQRIGLSIEYMTNVR